MVDHNPVLRDEVVGGDRDGNWAAEVSPHNCRKCESDRLAQQFFCLQLPSQPKVECRNCGVWRERHVVRLKHQKLGTKLGSDVRC